MPKIFGKPLKEYFLPIKYYILAAVLVVIAQYYIAVPLSQKYPFSLQLSQILWEILVAISVYKLATEKGFRYQHILLVGIFYSIIIHGLKAFFFRVFLFPYSGTAEEVAAKIIGKFLYGSLLVMAVAIGFGILLPYFKSKKML